MRHRRADLILLLEDGRIVERGSHETLMERRGKYYDMVVRQMASASKDVADAWQWRRGESRDGSATRTIRKLANIGAKFLVLAHQERRQQCVKVFSLAPLAHVVLP